MSTMSTPERRRMTKHKHTTPTSANAWRDRFRQGCMDRLKAKRSDNVNNLRQHASPKDVVDQVMCDEWRRMQLESPTLRRVTMPARPLDFGGDGGGAIDEYLSIFESVKQELLQEGERLYEEIMHFDNDYMNAAVGLLDSLLCPVCRRNEMQEENNTIYCACGVKLHTQDGSTNLQGLDCQLKNLVSTHSATCEGEAGFSPIDLTGCNTTMNLLMTCQVCDIMEVVI